MVERRKPMREGKKDILSFQIDENESSKYWLSVLNELKNRGVNDSIILCADGLTGREACSQAIQLFSRLCISLPLEQLKNGLYL